MGNNQAYYKTTVIDSVTTQGGPQFDPAHPVNNSPNNSGLNQLPPARGAFIWYPYAPSPDFPIVGTGGRTAEAGPVFYRDDFRNAARAFPQYYDGKLFIYEFMRHWIMAVTMDKSGDLVSIERFMPSASFAAPIEMEFAPSGDMYILEYGTIWFQGNDDARLVRVEYNAGNRKPLVSAQVDHPKGALPLRVALSSAGTVDLDEDSLRYEWTIARKGGAVLQRLTEPNPAFTFRRPGTYTAALTVTDAQGASTSAAPIEIVAGNQPPSVAVALVGSNTSFFFPRVPVRYAVRVTDREDGTLQSGRILARRVHVSAQYLKNGLPAAGASTSGNPVAEGRRLIEGGDCLSCHQLNRKSIGPTYRDVARKYHNDSSATARLIQKIRGGGSGVWGGVAMPAHPALTDEQAAAMVAYIGSLADTTTRRRVLRPWRERHAGDHKRADTGAAVAQCRRGERRNVAGRFETECGGNSGADHRRDAIRLLGRSEADRSDWRRVGDRHGGGADTISGEGREDHRAPRCADRGPAGGERAD